MLSEQIKKGRWKDDLKDVRAVSSPLVRVLLFNNSCTSGLLSGRRLPGKPEKRNWFILVPCQRHDKACKEK